VRARAEKVDGGWRVTGTKVWTLGAHDAEAFIALVRTGPVDPQHRHDGLSQLIVDLRAPGVRISPIISRRGGITSTRFIWMACSSRTTGCWATSDRVAAGDQRAGL
jgi:alkylation response protein AidB-like acyl-CoA dehydrogenase